MDVWDVIGMTKAQKRHMTAVLKSMAQKASGGKTVKLLLFVMYKSEANDLENLELNPNK